MSLVPKDSTGVLQAVIRKGSEAYEKGVRTGDNLIEADGIPIDDVCTYIAIRQRKKPGEGIYFYSVRQAVRRSALLSHEQNKLYGNDNTHNHQ